MLASFPPGRRADPHGDDTASWSQAPAPATSGGRRRRVWWSVVGLAAASTLGWLPFAGRALSPDEGGFLMLAAQWGPGSSLYGDYWVDRPPVLVGLFALADALGGQAALRAMGVLAVVSSVLLAGLVGRLAAPTSSRAILLPSATAAVFLASPLLGGSVVNGEVLGLPLVLAGFAAALASLSAPNPRSAAAWAVAAGAAGAAAFLVKQSLADVFVLVLALALTQWRPPVARLVAGALGGAALTVGLVLRGAELRGTGAGDLWAAVVTFRGDATATIAQSATASTAGRLGGLLMALVVSGVPLVAGALAWEARRRSGPGAPDVDLDLRWPAYAVLAWEAAAVLLGGSYWLHYLMGVVPGLVLLAAAAAQRRPSLRGFVPAYAVAASSALVAICWVAVHPIGRPEAPVIAYLADHARPGETGVVAFGGANILEAVEMESPYPHLWSLPVRVRDPDLHELAEVLAGPEAPTWLVVSGTSLDSWGIEADGAERHVDDRYELVERAGRFTIYRLGDVR